MPPKLTREAPTKLFFPKLEPATLPLLTAWSYTRYADYKRCPMFFAYKHLLRIKEPAGPAMQRGRDIHKEGEVYLSSPRKPRKVPDSYGHFREEMEQLRGLNPSVEQQWGFRQDWTPTGWFDKDCWTRNVLDVCVVYDDHTADVIDHKTGKKYGSNDEQMELFGLVTFCKFPEVIEVTTRLWYLDIADPRENRVEADFKKADEAALKKDWAKKVKPMFMDRKFPPRPNDKCKWCFLSKEKGGPCKF
jgi:hypothetical protein